MHALFLLSQKHELFINKNYIIIGFCEFLKKNTETEELAQDSGHTTPHPSDVLDMPVDPNEPTYCLCHQVSYGEMIGCDNPDVNLLTFIIFIKIEN